MENKEAILRRLQKLLAISGDHRADQNEAAAAASMAQKIMAKYQIDHQELLINTIKDDLEDQTFTYAARKNKPFIFDLPYWVKIIGTGVGKLNDVETCMCWGVRGQSLKFMGHKLDVQLTVWTTQYLCETVSNLCNQFKGGMSEKKAYREGLAVGIVNSIQKQIRLKQGSGTGLVLAKKAAIEEKFGKQEYLNSERPESEAKTLGIAVGRTVDINRRAIENEVDESRRLK